MTDYLEAMRQMEEIENNRAAQRRLTPAGETPTADFTGAPITAKAVLQSADPMAQRDDWDKLGWGEKAWNSVWGGIHNLQKSSSAEDIVNLGLQMTEGIASSLREDLEERFGDDEDSINRVLDPLRGSNVDKDFKEQKKKELNSEIENFLNLRADDYRYPVPQAVTRAAQATEGKGFIDSVVPYLAEVAKDPLNYAVYLTGSSMGAIAPSLFMSMVSGKVVGGVFKMGTTARAIQTALMGYGSYQAEIGGYFENYLQEQGYDLNSHESIQKALETENLSDLIMRGKRRAATVGVMDAIAAWVAPIRLNPSNALRYLRRAQEATPMKMVPTSRLYNFGKGAENLTMQTSLQGILGGAGEALGQLINGENINWGDVFAEAFGELTSAPVEVIGLATSANAKFKADSEYCQTANKFNETAKQVTEAVRAVSQTMKEGETLQQWAQKVGEGTPLFAYAQDLVEQGVSEKVRETNPELADKIEEAARQKTDVTLSMSDVLTLATKDEALAQSVVFESRVDADGMSPRQAQDFLKNGKEEATKKFQEIVERAKPDTERRKLIKAEVDKLRDQLINLGMTQELAEASTMPWTAKLAVLCKQLNTTPEDVMNRLNLQIKRQMEEQQQKEEALRTLMQEVSTALPSNSAVTKGLYEQGQGQRQQQGQPQSAPLAQASPLAQSLMQSAQGRQILPTTNFGISTRPNSGYSGNKSIRALNAEALGGMPWSGWNKQSILDEVEAEYGEEYPEIVEAVKKASLSALKDILLENQEWHHVGSNYRPTAYFFVRYILDKNEAQEIVKSLREYKKSPAKAVRANIDGRVYSGVLNGATFRYVDEEGKLRTKTVSSRHKDFDMARGVREITDESEAQAIRDKISALQPHKKASAPRKIRFVKVRTKDGSIHYAKTSTDKLARLVPRYRVSALGDSQQIVLGVDAEVVEELNDNNALDFANGILDEKIKYAEDQVAFYKNSLDSATQTLETFEQERDGLKYQNSRYRYLSERIRFLNSAIEDKENSLERHSERLEKLKEAKANLESGGRPNLNLLSLLQLAFHGSPYWFEAFSTKNIGTGEGAQAHGWGLYFALDHEVARSYRDKLSGGHYLIGGRDVDAVRKEIERKAKPGAADSQMWLERLEAFDEWYAHRNPDAVREAHDEGTVSDGAFQWFETEIRSEISSEGRLYAVDIPEDDVMLHEDAKFEDQPPKVQEALKKLFPERYSKEATETERVAWLEEVKSSQEIKDAFWKMPETYKAFIAIAEKEGPSGYLGKFTDLTKKLRPAIEKDAKVAWEVNQDNGADETVEEIAQSLFDEISTDILLRPVRLLKSRRYRNLSMYAESAVKRAKAHKAWLREIRSIINDDLESGEVGTNSAKGLKKLAHTEGPSIFLDRAKLRDKLLPYLRKDAQETYEDEKADRGEEDFTLDDWAGEIFEGMERMGTLGLYGEVATKHQTEVDGLALKGMNGKAIYNRLSYLLGGDMQASLMLNKYGIQGIRYNGYQDGECAVVFDDAMIKIIETLQQLAYHSTGFNDPILKFSLDHVGEGEGAQAHGYGLYFALAKAVAQGHREKLSKGSLYEINDQDSYDFRRSLEEEAIEFSGERRKRIYDRLAAFDVWYAHNNVDDVKEAYDNGEITLGAYRWFNKEVKPNIRSLGGLYLVDIPEDNVMLREGARFSEQSPEVQEALRKVIETLKPKSVNSLYEYLKDEGDARNFYKGLTKLLGSAKEASELLNKHGIRGMRYNGQQDGECAVVWDEESIKIQERLAQVKAQLESAAALSARGDFTPSNTASGGGGMGGVLRLMQNADKSTFMHESAHAWLDLDTMLGCDIAEKMERGEELTEGEQAFMRNLGGFFRWGQQEGKIDLGVTEDIATVATAVKRWSKMTVHEQREMHELFAEGFEAYLYEGKAPNKEMQNIFDRFKVWLKDLYQRIAYTPMVLSPEVRKLYDLMFASEQQAQDSETRMGFRALITAEMGDKLGMTQDELTAYNNLVEKATLETEGLVAKAVHGAMQIFGRVRKEEARRLEKERKNEIKEREEKKRKEPRFQALSMLNSNKVKISKEGLRSFGLDEETIGLFEERGWVSEEGGVSLHVLASTVGTEDVQFLLCDLLDIKSMSDAHDEAVREIAWEESVEHEGEGDFRELQANLCAYNETRSRLLTAEFNAIARKLGSQQMLVSAARDYAQEQIGKIAVNKLHPKSYMAAERRNIKEAEEAFRKGDFQRALEAKRAQIVNHEMARAAMEAQERYDRGVRVAKRALKSKTIHPQFKRVIDALLSVHSIKSMTEKERAEYKLGEPLTQDKVDEFLKILEDNGTPVNGLKEFLDSRKPVPAVEMTVDESRDFFEVVKEVAALGRNLLRQNLTEERENIADICRNADVYLTDAADAQGRPLDLHQHVAHTEKQRKRMSLSDFLLSHTKIATWFRIFDQNKAGGFFWNLFIHSANRCANFENEQRARASQYLAEKFASVFAKNQEEDPVIVEGFSEPFTHGMRLAVALNWGNQSNRDRLVSNDPRFTPDAIQAIFEHLTEADWRAVEAVWKLFGSFRPMIEEKEMRVRGIAPEWIEYSPFEVTAAEGKKITVSGGYYPVKYDPEASNSADKYTSADEVEQEMKGAYQSATTRESFLKSRAKGKVTNMPLRLDLNPLYEGLNDVIHDLAWHEWLIDTKKVLNGVPGVAKGLRESIKERYGSQVTREIERWRTDIAVGGRNPAAVTWAAKLASCIGVSTMGYSLTSAVVQLTGMGYVIPRVGVNAFVVGLAKYMGNPIKANKIIREKSKAMQLRGMTQFKEISQIRNRLEQGHGVKTWLHDHAFVLISLVQSIADSVCWLSAYEKYSREENISEDKLVAMCDQVVIDTQSSGNINDLSRIERDKQGLSRLFTIFYSWMNAALNLAVGEYLGETNKFKKTANLLFMCAVMPVVEKAFRDSLTAKGDDDDDEDEDPLMTYVREPLSAIAEYNLGLFTGVTRECASAASNLISGDRIYGYSGPAGVRLMAHVNNAFSVAANPNELKVMKAIIDLLGDLRGIPSVQINRTIKGLRAVNSGQAEDVDAIKAPLFGYKGRVYD